MNSLPRNNSYLSLSTQETTPKEYSKDVQTSSIDKLAIEEDCSPLKDGECMKMSKDQYLIAGNV